MLARTRRVDLLSTQLLTAFQNPPVRILVGRDISTWHDRFMDAIDFFKAHGVSIESLSVTLERSAWSADLRRGDVVLWKPHYMGAAGARLLNERVRIMERDLGVRSFPNESTVWHFENKIAQEHILRQSHVKTPRTIATYDAEEALAFAEQMSLPVVVKFPEGAGSAHVALAKTRPELRRIIQRRFCHQLWRLAKSSAKGKCRAAARSITHAWFLEKIWRTIRQDYALGLILQEFIGNNDRDLRVTTIGDRFATAFWWSNRPKDFRASGSGRLDFTTPIPIHIVEMCLETSRRNKFDTMAYDVLRTEEGYVVIEISYGYLDTAVYKSGRYFVSNGETTVAVHSPVWPQALWVAAVLIETGEPRDVSRIVELMVAGGPRSTALNGGINASCD